MNPKKIRAAMLRAAAAAQAIIDACESKGVIRAMTAEETTAFDTEMRTHDNLKALLKRAKEVGEVGEEEDEETEAEEDRSGKRKKDDDDERDEEMAGKRKKDRSGRASNPNQFDGQSPAVHTRKRSYSILRAFRSAMNGRRIDGLEGEVSVEVRGRVAGKTYRGQFSMPVDPDPEIRALMFPNASRRDLTTSSGVGGIFTVPEMPMIELLRAKMVLARLGCPMLSGMQGNFAIPRQSGKSTVYWLGEDSSASTSNATLDQVPFTPKVAVDIQNISRQFINQTSVSAEAFVMNDLAKTMAIEFDRVGINGLGSGSNQPLGIMQNTTIQTNSAALAVGANGGALAWANVVNAETQVSDANADQGRLAYLTSPAIRGTLKTTPKVTSTAYPIFIWEKGETREQGVGEVNSYPAYTTTNVPRNLTKGSGSNLSALIFGNWEDLVLASWDDGIDFLVNPYSGQASAAVAISMEMSVDCEVRHPESFALISDASYNAF
jgi:HK97 family phage major capsid protein